jgi:hypothetical protein
MARRAQARRSADGNVTIKQLTRIESLASIAVMSPPSAGEAGQTLDRARGVP